MSSKASMDPKARAPEAGARSRIYGLLSLVYGGEPGKELLAELGRGELRAALAECGLEFSGSGDNIEAALAELAAEFAALFLVPAKGRVAPQESVNAESGEGELMGPEALDVNRFLAELGLTLKRTDLLPDHIAVELEVLRLLTDREARAWQAGDAEKAAEYRKAELFFFKKHLKWLPRFTEDVEKAAKTSFYRRFAVFTREFAAGDLRELKKS